MMLRWFVGLLLLLTVQWLPAESRYVFVSAPNIIRVGNIETVLVTVLDPADDASPVAVTVTLKNVDESEICPPQVVNVDPDNPEIVSLFIDPANIPVIESEDDVKLYARVEVTCIDLCSNIPAKDVLISYEKGFVFIQTDKPIYTPDQRVNIRLLILDQYLHPSDQVVQLDVRTPQDVIVQRISDIRAHNGFKTHTFQFPQEPLFGNWSVVAHYGSELKSNRSVQFEVKEYVLPTFSVKLTTPDHILPGDEDLDFDVAASYVYGKPVRGYFYAKVGILEFDGEINIKQKIAGELVAGGIGHFQLTTGELGDNWFAENVEKRLYVEVSVLETASGISENVSDTSVKFVHSPYTFKWDRTVQYFKKGLPYQVKVDLVSANGRPANMVPIEVTATCNTTGGLVLALLTHDQDQTFNTNNNGHVNFRLYVGGDCDIIRVKLETKVEVLIRNEINNNAKFQFDVQPYSSPSGSDFLMIRRANQDDREVDVDQHLELEAILQTDDPSVPYLAYYVVSKGKISQANFHRLGDIQVQGFRIRVTYDMAPTARIVAFYVNQNGDVIADTIWIDIRKRCENHLELGVPDADDTNIMTPRADDEHLPDTNIKLGVTGEAGTTVGLLAVDKAVYLLRDYHRLTSDKMYKTMDKYDTGCGPGGGRDSPDVFKNAGVTVLTNAGLDVERREDYGCGTPLNPRRRRSVQDQLQLQLDGYLDELNLACRRGHRLLGATFTCEQRGARFTSRLAGEHDEETAAGMLEVFLICCQSATELQIAVGRGRSGGQGGLVNPDLIEDFAEPQSIRSDFRETWIHEQIEIGDNGLGMLIFTIPSSITEWSVSAVGLSDHFAMCVAEPFDVLVKKDIFIQLHMPYSVVRKEQVEIVATIFNYQKNPVSLDVFIRTPTDVCSTGRQNAFSDMREILVEAEDATSVRYVLIGMAVGKHPIEVAAYIPGFDNSVDAVKKFLRVVPEGIERSQEFSSSLDPTGSLSESLDLEPQAMSGTHDSELERIVFADEGRQTDRFNFSLPSGVVPNSERCELSIIGTVLGPVVTAMIDGLESLLSIPMGCGEQTMIRMAPNVYVLRYLISLDAATADLEAKAINNINIGILGEMTYRKPDGSFSVFTSTPISSSWLTAFVNKVFCHATEIEGVFVDPNQVTCKATEWLIDTAQRADGAFYETARVYHREMTGGVQGDATLTAFILISILECECATLSTKVADSTWRATAFLEGQLDNIQRPYAMAIVTYALALANSPQKGHANTMLKSMATYDAVGGLRYWGADGSSLHDSSKPYWYRRRPSAITVETTGYALLAQVAMGDISYSNSIVKWLSEQQNYGGGFTSTQDTTIALQALSEYSVSANHDPIDMTCSFPYKDDQVEFTFNEENALVQQQATPSARDPFTVTTVGRGTGKLNVKVTYNTIFADEIQCPFEILINQPESEERQDEEQQGGNSGGRSRIGRKKRQEDQAADDEDLLVSVEVAYVSNEPTNMAIIDVGIYSGYKADKDDLDQIRDNNDYHISRYEISQRSVIFYADEIPPVDSLSKLRLEFRVHREFEVGNLQPVPVKVYDYYNTTAECVKFYHRSNEETASTLASLCEGDLCVCAAGDCFDCGPNTKEVLLERSCMSGQTYAYKILIIGKRKEVGFNVYNARILLELKAADDNFRLGDVREFWISNSCTACTKRLKVESEHLVIGETALAYATKDNEHSFKYILDDSASLESWPRVAKGRQRTLQLAKMNQFKTDMQDGNNNCR